LYGRKHQDLKVNNFVKRYDGGINIKLFRSKINQRGLSNNNAQAETISLPNIKEIIDDYELYFTKYSATAIVNFYLKLYTAND
ncbi:30532_t:CDS:1, partial [Racocetra persica]